MSKEIDPEKIDSDNPEWTSEMFSEAKSLSKEMPDLVSALKKGPGRPKLDSPKKHIGFRLDADVVDWLRSHKGYNALVNDAVRDLMTHD